ncbi:MAG TPA: serine hydrolase domain-containing protein [bacterium]|nr:serine hydrolase domain-containing protein [bacterium]
MDNITAAFVAAVQAKVFSGAQFLHGVGDEVRYLGAFGKVSEDPDSRNITKNSLFDIASLTKPISTAALFMVAFQESKIDLDQPIQDWLPNFKRAETLSLKNLLNHDSGLPAWLPLFEEVRGKNWNYDKIRDFYIDRIAAAPLLAAPGANRVYSDLGFILLGFALEKIFGRRLDPLFQEKIAGPLAMEQTLFHPLNHIDRIVAQDIAATEICPWRGRLILGEVHDDNAHVLGGAAGHAGLFGSAQDLGRFAREILAAREGKGRIFKSETLERFLGAQATPKLGWDTISLSGSQAGSGFAADQSVGHLAFTGCSLWIDFSDGKYIVLLTNRVHPRRDNEAIKEFRPRIHDLLLQS